MSNQRDYTIVVTQEHLDRNPGWPLQALYEAALERFPHATKVEYTNGAINVVPELFVPVTEALDLWLAMKEPMPIKLTVDTMEGWGTYYRVSKYEPEDDYEYRQATVEIIHEIEEGFNLLARRSQADLDSPMVSAEMERLLNSTVFKQFSNP